MRRLHNPLLESRVGRLVLATGAALALVTAIGLVLLWPNHHLGDDVTSLLTPNRDEALVTGVAPTKCASARFQDCKRIKVKLLTGAIAGVETVFKTGENGYVPKLSKGDHVSLLRAKRSFEGGQPVLQPYQLGDPHRGHTLVWLAVLFALAVTALGRRRGALSLVGLGLSVAIVFVFMIPAILSGRSPVLVALVGGLAVVLATTLVAQGIGAKSMAAVLGTAASLLATVLLATLFTHLAKLSGFTSDESQILRFATKGSISLQGLVLAGMVIATLGVLTDVTISQASAVVELQKANPAQRFADLYASAVAIGRDHVSATVNTLVLAYVGASLPVLLLFGVSGVSVTAALDQEDVAEQVVATLVGSIGLVAAVPLTTALAAALAVRLPRETLAAEPHSGHVH